MKNVCLLSMALWLLAMPASAYRTDPGIEASILNSYIFKEYLQGDHIGVHSQNGVVTLTGTVADENDKFLAQDTAENMSDVKSVVNRIQVRGKPPATYSDEWIAIKVKTALLFHRRVNALGIHVDVRDGVVTLSGDVGNEAQKELATEYAKDIDGVKGIHNVMEVKPDVPQATPGVDTTIDDASITAQIEMTLLAHRSTSVLRTHVSTRQGKVTVTGKALNEAEKELVSKLVSDINGVKGVTNNMQVE